MSTTSDGRAARCAPAFTERRTTLAAQIAARLVRIQVLKCSRAQRLTPSVQNVVVCSVPREYLVPRMSLSGHSLRQSARTLAKHRGFTSIAILSLALAIALNTTMYSVLDAMINPRIDAREPERLFGVTYFGDYRRRLP